MHGLESTEESAAFFIDYCRTNHGLLAIRADDETGGNYMRLTSGMSLFLYYTFLGSQLTENTGTQSIAKGLAGLIGHERIHLSSPVVDIENKSTYVVVTTRNGRTFEAKKLIVSIPSTMYRELQFSPLLPSKLRQMTDATRLGHYNKALVFYFRPWWRDQGFNGFLMSFKGPVCVARDTSIDAEGIYCLTCFLNGSPGDSWAQSTPYERRRVIVEQLADVFNLGPRSEAHSPKEYIDQVWKSEEFSRGALVPVPAIGDYTKFAGIYGKPVGNIHFVGTEYSKHWKGYIEGALASGEEGAKEVIDSLAQQNKFMRPHRL